MEACPRNLAIAFLYIGEFAPQLPWKLARNFRSCNSPFFFPMHRLSTKLASCCYIDCRIRGRGGQNRHMYTAERFSRLSQCFVTFSGISFEGLPGQYIAAVSAHHPGEFPKSSSTKPCDRREKNAL